MAENENIVIDFDQDALTLGDIETIEEYTGQLLDEFLEHAKAKQVTSKEITVMIYIAQHAKNPAFTIEDAKNIRVTRLDFSKILRKTSLEKKKAAKRRPPGR